MKATEWATDKITKKPKKVARKINDEQPTPASIREFIHQISASALKKLKREETRATEVQTNLWAKIRDTLRRQQEEEEQLLTAFLFDII